MRRRPLPSIPRLCQRCGALLPSRAVRYVFRTCADRAHPRGLSCAFCSTCWTRRRVPDCIRIIRNLVRGLAPPRLRHGRP
jgi:hypothetical protein